MLLGFTTLVQISWCLILMSYSHLCHFIFDSGYVYISCLWLVRSHQKLSKACFLIAHYIKQHLHMDLIDAYQNRKFLSMSARVSSQKHYHLQTCLLEVSANVLYKQYNLSVVQ